MSVEAQSRRVQLRLELVECMFSYPGVSENLATLSRRFQLHKRRQLFIRPYNETLSVAAVRVNNPDRSPFTINRCGTAPTRETKRSRHL